MNISQIFDQNLLAKYNTSGPRYTSYPTALEFKTAFNTDQMIEAITQSSTQMLSLYLHIPFCHQLCYYCGCNKIVTRHQHKADLYLDYLIKEIEQKAPLFSDYQINQIHLGGGTPSFLTKEQLTRLIKALKSQFALEPKLTMSIEIDPRELSLDYVDHLAKLGFNRMSIGVQDIDNKVQEAINRIQSTEFITSLVQRAKQVGFKSVNIDLIYGLPHQTPGSFIHTLDFAINLDIDRISLFSYAHLPSRFAAQRKLKDHWLPNATEKLNLMRLAVETLCVAGYEFIGMDHFAKRTDELAIAQKNGTLHRNFQGYTVDGDSDLLGLGVSAISAIGNSYSQNHKALNSYYLALNEHLDATDKGLTLNQDDIIRGTVIKALMCNMTVDKSLIEEKFNINFDQYFAAELVSLAPFISDELLVNSQTRIDIMPQARLLVRNICMTFDAYMQQYLNQQRFSRVI